MHITNEEYRIYKKVQKELNRKKIANMLMNYYQFTLKDIKISDLEEILRNYEYYFKDEFKSEIDSYLRDVIDNHFQNKQ